MSLAANETFASALSDALREARLSDDAGTIIGKKYLFGCEHGSHHQILCGTITALWLSDERGLMLEVSNRHFWGGKIVGLRYAEGTWTVVVEFQRYDGSRYIAEVVSFVGELMLL